MIKVQKGGSSDLARQRARHKLFVEGSGDDTIDAVFLKNFFGTLIDIECMGPSFHLKSVATALHAHHPEYYFLIDRDHHDEKSVEASWRNFPDPATSNLLIWKKKEIENIFLEPDYLQRSQYIKEEFKGQSGQTKLESLILQFARKRLFMEAANSVVLAIREEQKTTWIETFTKPSEFETVQAAKSKLLKASEFQARSTDISNSVQPDILEQKFEEVLNDMSGGTLPLEWNRGLWRAHMSGKEVLKQVVNQCFQVRDRNKKVIQGHDHYIEVIKDLARQDQSHQPDDFRELYRLIENAINRSV